MFTQCSKCETVFRLSAEALRAAGGQVRCGRCGEVFNALSRLAEDPSGFVKGESPLFLETRADEILESSSSDLLEPPADIESSEARDAAQHRDLPDVPPGVEVAQLHFIEPVDDELAEETSLEFTLPPGELDRIFVETRPSPLQQLAADGYRPEPADVIPLHPEALPPPPEGLPPPPPHPEALAAPPESLPAHPESFARVNAASMLAPAIPTSSPPAPQPESPVKLPLGPAPPIQALPARVTGLEVSETVRRELSSLKVGAGRDPFQSKSRSGSPPQARGRASHARLPFAAWLAAAIVLGMLLLIQVVRGSSDWAAVHMPLLGVSRATANLSVYQLRQWGVTGDPGAKGTLRVRASIMNTAPELQAYPLLRVTLVDRFGARVGAREFEPAEYLGHGIASMLAPGERVDATLDILDPGKDAEGFEIDVCIRSAEKKIFCAGDAAAQAK